MTRYVAGPHRNHVRRSDDRQFGTRGFMDLEQMQAAYGNNVDVTAILTSLFAASMSPGVGKAVLNKLYDVALHCKDGYIKTVGDACKRMLGYEKPVPDQLIDRNGETEYGPGSGMDYFIQERKKWAKDGWSTAKVEAFYDQLKDLARVEMKFPEKEQAEFERLIQQGDDEGTHTTPFQRKYKAMADLVILADEGAMSVKLHDVQDLLQFDWDTSSKIVSISPAEHTEWRDVVRKIFEDEAIQVKGGFRVTDGKEISVYPRHDKAKLKQRTGGKVTAEFKLANKFDEAGYYQLGQKKGGKTKKGNGVTFKYVE